MKENFLANLIKSDGERRLIERDTSLQSETSEWLCLLTPALPVDGFKFIEMRPDSGCASLVKQLLNKINIDAAPIQHGRYNEKKKTLDQLSRQAVTLIRPYELFIDPDIPYLGAIPAGLIEENTRVEVKCPISAHKTGLDEAIAQNKVF